MSRTVSLLPVIVASGWVLTQSLFAQPQPPARHPEVVTDQPDYSPGATANIIGADFLPKETVRLQVLHADGTPSAGADHQPWLVQASAHGDFLTTWHVCEDDCLGSELRLSAVGLHSGFTAEALFSDGIGGGNSGGGGGGGGTSAVQFQGWFNVWNQWGGTIQGNNSQYGEGYTVPLRFTANMSPGSIHTLLLQYDFSTGGTQRFFDSLGSYNAIVANPPLLAGITNPGSPLYWALPLDTSLPVGAQLPGVMTAYNVSSLSFGSYTLVNGVKSLPVTFTVASGGTGSKSVVLGYGGHLAGQIPWGAGNGASQFPGASQKAYASLDGASAMNVSVHPGTILPAADLALVKLASPEPVYSGDNLSYQLTVQNIGPDAASSVVVTDPLPAGVAFLSANASQGTYSGTSTLSFALGSINPGSYATISIVVKVALANAGTLTNTATVSSATLDPNSTNNTATIVSTVKIRDVIPPVVTCPATIVRPTDPGQCSAVVWYTATATDNVQVASFVCSPPSGSTFPQGTNTVTCTATDTSGNMASCSFKVVVLDTQPPSITCPVSILATNDPGQCSAVVNFNLVATDNCPGVTVGSSPRSGYAFPVGTNTVLCVAQDAAGNTNLCTFTITVLDQEPPRIVCPTNVVALTDPGRCDAKVSFASPAATDNCGGPVTVTCNPPSGSVFALGTNLVVCTAVDSAGNSNSCVFPVIVLDAGNVSWPQALSLALVDNAGVQQATYQECLTALDQSRWFKFKVQPGSRVIVTLTELPENYDLVVFKDIAQAYSQLASAGDLVQASAQSASDAFSSAAFSPGAFASFAFAPGAFAPGAFAPGAFAPGAFAPGAFAPGAFAPGAFAPDAFAPGAFAPGAFAPGAFAPGAFAPGAFAPGAFAPGAFAAAQIESVMAVSAFDGVANEGIIVNTWDNNGYFYARVRGRNGVYSPGNPFRVTVYQQTGACASVSPVPLNAQGQPLPPSTTAAPAGNYKTIILADLNRWLGSGPSAAKTNITLELAALAARPEVAGVVVDVGADPWVTFFNTQADANYACPYAKNLVAGAIKSIVDRSRAGNALQYVVLIGNDSVIPFFRFPDEALLGPERDYVPPVRDMTASQASLRLGYVLNQDIYGAQCNLALKTMQLPLPDLAVGRLVETPGEVTTMIDAYLATTGGVAGTASALVTGYDFLADDAQAVSNELALAMGTVPDTLISPNTLPPSLCWTADNLRQALLGSRHDLMFIAGHFSASGALAADYTTHVLASELAQSTIDFRNSILISPGCHSGYNIVDADDINYVTLEPDWAQACARKGLTLIGGTGYQYGDTQFIEYSERLYLNLAQELRTGRGAVSLGQALVNAKRVYLAATPEMRPIHAKTYLEATLFGLPMLSVNMPGARRSADVSAPIVSAVQPVASNPGATLGLAYADVAVKPSLVPTQVPLTNTDNGSQTIATFLAGGDGIINNPAEPVLPLEVRNVAVNGTVLRGVGFRSGAYADLLGIVPLTGAPATEIRGVHASFLSEVFYPIRPWDVNYFGALCGLGDGATRLMVMPAQFRSDSPTVATGTLREFTEMDFRLFYSANITTYTNATGDTTTPGLAAPPSISGVVGVTSPAGDVVALNAHVVGDPNAGIQAVWVTYTALTVPYAGKWQSLDLVQNAADSTLWQGTLPVPAGTSSRDIRYLVQAVNGVGAVTLDTKLGAYHIPDEFDSGSTAQLAPTAVSLLQPPTTGAYGTPVVLRAQLTALGGTPLPFMRMVFRLGDQEVWGTTDTNGIATATLPLLSQPDSYAITASFPGATGLAPSFATSPFNLTRQTTALGIGPAVVYVKPNVDTKIIAALTDGAGNRMPERTVIFVVTGPNGSYAIPVITDVNGRAPLGPVPLPAGSYVVTAYFNGVIPVPGQSVTVDDGRYLPSTTAGTINVTLVVDDQPPVITCSTNVLQSTAPGRCDAVVNFVTTATDNNPGVSVVCTPPSGSVFPKGATLVTCVATDSAGNTSTCGFTVTVVDTEPPMVVCPSNIVTTNVPGLCSAPVNFSILASDNCGPVTVVATPPSGSSFPVGTNLVRVVATDSSGNTNTCAFTVTVLDVQPPQISCPQNLTVGTDPGKITAVVNFAVTATDNCPGVSVVSSPVPGTAFPLGTNTVTCVATDASGNQSRCGFTVTVKDLEPPVIQSITANPNVLYPPNHEMILVTVTVNATDNSGIVNSRIVSVTSSDPTNTTGDGNTGGDWLITGPLTVYLRAERVSSGVGRTYTLTIQATDPSGNATTGTVTVFVPPSSS